MASNTVAAGCLRSLASLLVFGAVAFVGLNFYLDHYYWGISESWYRIQRDGDDIVFGCQNFAPVRFAAAPAPGVSRILVLGGSTTFGYPERPVGEAPLASEGYGLVGALQASLDAAWPGSYELINLGVNGGSSEDSLRLLRRALDWGPAGVVIYDGHNEYMTASSYFIPALWRFSLIRRLAMLSPIADTSPGWVGPAAYGGPAHEAALVRALRDNLEAMTGLVQGAGLPLVLSTQAGNLAGFDPNWSTAGDPASLQGLAALDDAALEARWAAAPDAAELAWAVGRRRLGSGDAWTPLRAAADLDGLPFRATSVMNAQIRAVALERGVPLVDAEAATLDGGEPPGNAMFYDWVHPRPPAAALLAGALLGGMREAGMIPTAPRVVSPARTSAEIVEAQVRTARSWLQWSCVRAQDPNYRLDQVRRYAGLALAGEPGKQEALGILAVAELLEGRAAELPPDPALRTRLGRLHRCIAQALGPE